MIVSLRFRGRCKTCAPAPAAARHIACRPSGTMPNLGTALAKPRAERLAYVRSARRVGLHYVDDQGRGWTRRRVGHGFRYLDERDRVIRSERALWRVRALAIPPAWTD